MSHNTNDNKINLHPNPWLLTGTVLLVILNLSLVYFVAKTQYRNLPETLGYILGQFFLVFLILAIAVCWKKNRTWPRMLKIVFFSLFFCICGNFSTLTRPQMELVSRQWQEIDPKAYEISAEQAAKVAVAITDRMRNIARVDSYPLTLAFAAEDFVKKVLRLSAAPSVYIKRFAAGAAEKMDLEKILSTWRTLASESDFSFVKFYHKQQPILQFRLTKSNGELHYMDLYLIQHDDRIWVEDFHHYASGPPLSSQILELAEYMQKNPQDSSMFFVSDFQNQLNEGLLPDTTAFYTKISSNFKQTGFFNRLLVQWLFNNGQRQNEIKSHQAHLSDDPSVYFLEYNGYAAGANAAGMLTVIDDLNTFVGHDEYLLWQKVNLLALEHRFQAAVNTLDLMNTVYHIDVDATALNLLIPRLLASAEYKNWHNMRLKN